MNKKYFLGILLLVGLLVPGLIFGKSGMMKVVNIKGKVMVKKSTNNLWGMVRPDMLLYPEDIIATKKMASVKIEVNKKVVEIGEEAVLELRDLSEDMPVSEQELFSALKQKEPEIVKQTLNKVPDLGLNTNRKTDPLNNQRNKITGIRGESGRNKPLIRPIWHERIDIMEYNGAKILYHYGYFHNSIRKCMNIIKEYPESKYVNEVYALIVCSLNKLSCYEQSIRVKQLMMDACNPVMRQ